jgi:hypothetical protein
MSDLHMMAAGKKPEERKALEVGDTVKHKSLGLAKIVGFKGDMVIADFSGKIKTLKGDVQRRGFRRRARRNEGRRGASHVVRYGSGRKDTCNERQSN